MRFIINYKLTSSSNFVETKLQSLIEVPYCDEDENPGVDFIVTVIYAKSEINIKAKLRFPECKLNYET